MDPASLEGTCVVPCESKEATKEKFQPIFPANFNLKEFPERQLGIKT
jgi:hypothetical protein